MNESGQNTKIWFCKIGEIQHGELPKGSDLPMRVAVAAEYRRLTGQEPKFIFSGWGAVLTEPERAAHENRIPSPTPGTPLSPQATQQARDAERYRWLAENEAPSLLNVLTEEWDFFGNAEDQLENFIDATIDAARSGGPDSRDKG